MPNYHSQAVCLSVESESQLPCTLYLRSVPDVVPGMQLPSARYDRLIERIPIGLPIAIIHRQVLHVNWEL